MVVQFRRALALLFIAIPLFAAQNFILLNDGILPDKTINKINEIGNELYKKSGVGVYVAVVKRMPTKKITDFEKNLTKQLKSPYVLLTLSIKDHKVDIVNSKGLKNKFDKESILSPLPWKGTIIPILTSHSKNPKAAIEAAILNGYADIAEQIADSYGIDLKSAIGSVNKNIYYWLRVLFYSIIALVIAKYLFRRVVKK